LGSAPTSMAQIVDEGNDSCDHQKNVRGIHHRLSLPRPDQCHSTRPIRPRVRDRWEPKIVGPEVREAVDREVSCKPNGQMQEGARSISDRQDCASSTALQGPIDDAFVERFIFVRPKRQGAPRKNSARGPSPSWSAPAAQMAHRFSRGDVIVKDDTAVHHTGGTITNTRTLVLLGRSRPATRCCPVFFARLPVQLEKLPFENGQRTS